MYWPARYCRFWLAGSCSFRIITSAAARCRLSTRAGIFSTGNSPAPGTLRASITQSVCAAAQQGRIKPGVLFRRWTAP